MLSRRLRALCFTGTTQHLEPVAEACAPLLRQLVTSAWATAGARGGACSSSGVGSAAPLAATRCYSSGTPAAADPDPFTAAMRQKTEEELRKMTVKEGQQAAEGTEEKAAADGAVTGDAATGQARRRECVGLPALPRQGARMRCALLLPSVPPNVALVHLPCLQAGPHGQREIGGYKGPEPTRWGDWDIKGR